MTTRGNTQADGSRGSAAWRRWWAAPVKLVLTVGVTWLILHVAGVGLEDLRTVDWTVVRPHPPLLVLSVVLIFATFAIAAALWCRILQVFGEARIGVADGAAILLIANLGRYVPGKILQLAGVAVLARRRGLSAVGATAAAVTAQILNLLGAVTVGGWVALSSADPAQGPRLALGVAALVALAAFLYFGGAGVLLRWILGRTGHTGDLPQPEGRELLLLLPGYILNWVAHGAAFVCLSRGLGLDPGFWAGTTAFAAAYFTGYIMLFAPAGIGVRESWLVVLLTPLLGPEASLVLAALQRVWITGAELGGAAIGAFVLRGPVAPAPTPHTRPKVGGPAAGGAP